MTINRKTRRLSHQSWHGRHAPSHSIFKGPGAIRGPLFMRSKVYASIPFRPAGAPAEAEIPPIVPVSSMPIMCARPCVSPQNRNDMAASGAAPVSGVRVMGCVRGRGRGEQARGAAGSAAVRSGINFVAFEERVTVWCCGQDWCDSRCDFRESGT